MIPSKKKEYLDRHKFHSELAECKKAGELSRLSIKMFKKLATEVSKNYYFIDEDERNDCISQAMHDLCKYWKNFKDNNLVQIPVGRLLVDENTYEFDNYKKNFVPGDYIKIHIPNINTYEFIADTDFAIGRSLSASLDNMKVFMDSTALQITLDKVKNKITFMDNHNNMDVFGSFEMKYSTKFPFIDMPKDKKKAKPYEIMNENEESTHLFVRFHEPPNAFGYFTSTCHNGIKKMLDKLYPNGFERENKISLSINSDNNGMFSL